MYICIYVYMYICIYVLEPPRALRARLGSPRGIARASRARRLHHKTLTTRQGTLGQAGSGVTRTSLGLLCPATKTILKTLQGSPNGPHTHPANLSHDG